MRANLVAHAVVGVSLLLSAGARAQSAPGQVELPRPSPNAKLTQTVGVTDITVEYSSPGVKGRKIWGSVVPFGQVWRAGANAPTKITFSRDVMIADKKVPAGSYNFFVQPSESKWTLILSKNPTMSVFNYNKKDDLLRLDVTPREMPLRERLAYVISDFSDDSANIDLEWEKLRASLPVRLQTQEQVAASVKGLMNSGWSPWAQAARYELEQKRLDSAMELVDHSLALKETWMNLYVKAGVLAARGNFKEAHSFAEKAKTLGDKDQPNFFLKKEVEQSLKDWKSKS